MPDDRTYSAFLARLGVNLEPGQRVWAQVCFDGVDPCDLPDTDRAIARTIFGDIDRFRPAARDVIATVAGGRSGKTYLSALRLLHLVLTVDLSTLAPGERCFAAIVAPDLDLARQGVAFAAGAARSHPALARLIVSDTADALVLRRGQQIVAVRAFAARHGGVSGRGKSLAGLLMDESCFFYDSSHVVNDQAIYDAASVRVMAGGQTIVASTPWASSGLLYDFWQRFYGRVGSVLVAHAATRTMRSAKHILQQVDRAHEHDSENAEREFGARFLSSSATDFFDRTQLDAAVDPSLAEPQKPQPGDEIAAGGDLGFSKNSSALAVAHLRDRVVHVAELLELRPSEGKPLKPSAVVRAFADRIRWHGCSALVADSHYKETAREHLEEADLLLLDAPDDVAEPYVTTRTLLQEGRLRLPPDALLLTQLRAIKSKPRSGGGTVMVLPKTLDGRHCDVAAALVLAVHQAWHLATDQVEEERQEKPEERWKREYAAKKARAWWAR